MVARSICGKFPDVKESLLKTFVPHPLQNSCPLLSSVPQFEQKDATSKILLINILLKIFPQNNR
jgi:hypothetical protein